MSTYDVIVDEDKDKCEVLYKTLLKVDCIGLINGSCFLRDAALTGKSQYLRYAYRIYIEDDRIFYYGYKNRENVSPMYSISLKDFINIIQPERTVTL